MPVGERDTDSGGSHEERGGSASSFALDFTRERRAQWLRERERGVRVQPTAQRERV